MLQEKKRIIETKTDGKEQDFIFTRRVDTQVKIGSNEIVCQNISVNL